MKVFIKTFYSLFIVFVLSVIHITDVSVYASETMVSGDYKYKLMEDGSIEITAYSGSATELNIPDTIDSCKVTRIGENAFNNCSLMNVTIPEGVTSIGEDVFRDCSNLTSITIPNSVTSIGSDTFAGCDVIKLYGFADSYSSEYAKEYSIPFVDLNCATPPPSISMEGDINADNTINASDALDVLKHSAKLSILVDTKIADVNKDGNVDANDALLILKYAARIINEFPISCT